MTQTLESTPDPTIEKTSAPKLRLDYLDGLRALAALFVVAHHAWLNVWPPSFGIWPSHRILLLTGWLAYGRFGVCLFIVLSGLVLFLPVVKGDGRMRTSVGEFYKRRALRILPAYYGAIAFSLLLIYLVVGKPTQTHWNYSVPVSKHDILVHLLLLNDLFQNPKINHTHWSVAVEFKIYFLFPLLVLLWRRVGGILTTLLSVVGGYLFLLLLPRYGGLTPQYVGLFGLGMLVAGIALSPLPLYARLRAWNDWLLCTVVAFAALVAVCIKLGTEVSHYWAWMDLLAGIVSCLLLITLTTGKADRLRDLLSWRPLVAIGLFSYSLYLIHAPIIQVVWLGVNHLHRGRVFTFLLVCPLSLILSVIVSWGFSRFAEVPFTRRPAPTPDKAPGG